MKHALICLLLLFSVSVHAETRDGNWWLKQDYVTKLAYVCGSVDRTMVTASIDPTFKANVVGPPEMGEIVAHLDALYYRPERRGELVQTMLAMAIYEISQSAAK
jgi:hypothetical protein